MVTAYRAPEHHVLSIALCGSSYLVLETSHCGASVLDLQPRGVGHGGVKMTCPVSLEARLQSAVLHSRTICAPAGGVHPTLHVVRCSVRLLNVSLNVLIKGFYCCTSFYPFSSLSLPPEYLLVLKRRGVASMTVQSFDTWRLTSPLLCGSTCRTNFHLCSAVFLPSRPCSSPSLRRCPKHRIGGLQSAGSMHGP